MFRKTWGFKYLHVCLLLWLHVVVRLLLLFCVLFVWLWGLLCCLVIDVNCCCHCLCSYFSSLRDLMLFAVAVMLFALLSNLRQI